MSEWLEVLRDACEVSTQPAVARQISYSTTVVNQVLKGAYKGDLKRVQAAVEGALMGSTVHCPAVGCPLPRQRCIENQRAGFSSSNPSRVQFARTCPTCANNRGAPKPTSRERNHKP